MNIRGIIKEELNRQEYLYRLTKIYGDDQLASYYLESFCDELNRLNTNGGYVYKLAYESDEKNITTNSESTGWTLHKEALQSKTHHPHIFILQGRIKTGSVDMNTTMEKYVDNPEDQEVVLVKEPEITLTQKLK